MDNNGQMFYCISSLNPPKVTIIDSTTNSVVDDITVGERPFKLAPLNNGKICAACDKSGSISIIDCVKKSNDTIFISNNGIIETDNIGNRIFISDTSQVIVYDIAVDKIIYTITGFLCAYCLKLNKSRDKLYVLDKLSRKLSIYDTSNFMLIDKIEDIGDNPAYFLISDDDKKIYISSNNNILKIDIEKKKSENLRFEDESNIVCMAISGDKLYAADGGMNVIQIVDTNLHKVCGNIPTSHVCPNMLCTAYDTNLLVANRGQSGQGSLDIIDTKANSVINTISLDEPYDVISIPSKISDSCSIMVAASVDTNEIQKGFIKIIAKRVFACYFQTKYFKSITMKVPMCSNPTYTVKSIKFKKGFIVPDSEKRTVIKNPDDFFKINFKVNVEYTVCCLKGNEEYNFNSFLQSHQEVIFKAPSNHNIDEFKVELETEADVIDIPKVDLNLIKFGASVFMKVQVIGDDEIMVPAF